MRRLTILFFSLLLFACASGDPAHEKAWEAMVAQDYAAARDRYENILAERPDDAYAHLNLGVAYANLGNYPSAREHYNAAIKYGGDAKGSRVVEAGQVSSRDATVADLARANLQTLPQ